MPRLIRPDTISRHLKRYRQVVQVLVKHGFGQVIDQLHLWEDTNIQRRIPKIRKHDKFTPTTLAERVRLALEELGPTFIKLGQLVSTRPDLVPHAYIAELEKLQNQVAPIPDEIAMKVVRAELNRPLEEVFSSFEEKPAAAASLSQVYRATLKSGEVVAVKVQRPGITELVQVDLEIMHDLAARLDRYFEQARAINLTSLVEEFASDMKRELNFVSEANNIRHFAHNFTGNPSIHVPVVFMELCTPNMLVTEFMDGLKITDTDKLGSGGYDLALIAHRGADIYLKSILEDGFFHADPHPGNVLVLPDNVICLLDFGMMGRLSAVDREVLSELLAHVFERDAKGVTRALLEICGPQVALDSDRLEMEVSYIIEEYAYMSLHELQLGDFFGQLMQLIRTYHLHLPRHYIWLLKVIATVENTARRLDPNFNLAEYSRPFIQKLLVRHLNPLDQVRKLRLTATDLLKLIKDLPYEARSILRQVREGRAKVDIELMGLEPMRRTLNHIFNRVVLALIVCALLISSSLIVLSGIPPLVSGIPVIGLSGFVIAALLGIWLIISVLRNGMN
jgi:ubiquinone biosynthesis protein